MTHPTFSANPITDAAETLLTTAARVRKPIIIAMHSPSNDHNLKSGESRPSDVTELLPSCNGVVVAVSCSAEEAQEFVDLVMAWQKKREGRCNR